MFEDFLYLTKSEGDQCLATKKVKTEKFYLKIENPDDYHIKLENNKPFVQEKYSKDKEKFILYKFDKDVIKEIEKYEGENEQINLNKKFCQNIFILMIKK
uniref:Uncharacterized protein n=1 Tax=Meloidogyne enterolobii TaxID=390850 RepID=A0A6V7WBR8_MELEN|nr:unnamed protein product [Meloidogyne enterolobii]